MSKNSKKNHLRRVVALIVLGLVGLALLITVLLQGNNVALFHPRGLIAHEQRNLMVLVVGILLIVAIPALFLVYFTAWKYRESNTKAKHDPNMRHSKLLDAGMWLIPTICMVVLVAIMWPATHRLDPHKAIAGGGKPLVIQVVALRWKWLFIYPEQQIATVNYAQIPVDTPVEFDLTADAAPMTSFWIPNLSGQLYAMTGHMNSLNISADTPGDYTGSSAEINGAGFAGMKFTAKVNTKDGFDFWVQSVKLNTGMLDDSGYEQLLKPSENNSPGFYNLAAGNGDLYDTVLMKYMGSSEGHMHDGMHY